MIDEIARLNALVEFYRRDYNTGLYGRHDMMARLRSIFDTETFWLSFHDVTGLHEVNRLHGWSAGDSLLKQVANDLQLCKEPCRVYLIGGDEFFTIHKTNPGDPQVRDAEGCTVWNKSFTSVDDMLDKLDKLVSERKRTLKRRRTDI